MRNKKIQTLREYREASHDHALAQAEIEEAKAHGAMKQEVHGHGKESFLKLLWLTITGQGGDES